ncbi:unnamed protein product [Rotaria sp. Silwood2]|nr:unnamed protein product [Rotaria sp. Silwood2]CAF3049550.1 unnamed protein product [Rotaria sp. Silwood2]CAF3112806.1 unnamed protein product [Rotaria sp. Silwood2]CAF3210328.1 unnamed protein product [Rotaria sp. Silwood2]CAF4254880.1 unnamed protein product [Rotaria sp. Silwood2]
MLPLSHPCSAIAQSTTPSPGLTLATCNSTLCKSSSLPCSSNLDCECFSLANTVNAIASGICAFAALPCSSMVRCNSDNITCSIPQTICVNSTRCQQPVCYPMALANIQICPPNRITSPTSTVTTTNSVASTRVTTQMTATRSTNTTLTTSRTGK